MKIGFLFAGQGSQKVGMGLDFYNSYPMVKELYDSLSLDFDIKDLCFNGPKEQLDQTEYAQSCILLTSYVISQVLKEYGIIPEIVAGLSLGEYSALCYAGIYSIQDALKIVGERGKIMQQALPAGTSTMAAVLNTEIEVIQEVCAEVNGICEIANYNCPGQIVITGQKAAIEEASKLLLERGARRVIPLAVSGAFHSSLLEDASKQLNEVLNQYVANKANIPVVYNYTGKESEENIIDILTKQIKSSVYFWQTIEYMLEQGVDTFIEIGPGSTLKGFIKKINRDVKVYSIENKENLEQMIGELK